MIFRLPKYLILALSFLISNACFSQDSPVQKSFERPYYQATFIENEPVVDGEIRNEALWQSIPLAQELIQLKPSFGAPVSEKTEIRVAYSNTTFYVAVICYDTEPDRIVVSDSQG